MDASKVQAAIGSAMDSQLFWGFVTLVLAAVAFSPKVSMNESASNLFLVLAWLVGCFGIYRCGLFSDWRHMLSAWLIFGGVLALIASYLQPTMPIRTSEETDSNKQVPQSTAPAPTQKPSEPAQPPVTPGLDFREVPPEQLGITKEFMLEFGTNRFSVRHDEMKRQMSFEDFGLQLQGNIPLSIRFNDKGKMVINADIYHNATTLAVRIRNNEFSVKIPDWDSNWDASAFEVVDQEGKVVFQIHRIKDNYIKIRGTFWTTTGSLYVVADNGIFGGRKAEQATPTKSLFKYPSATNLHKMA